MHGRPCIPLQYCFIDSVWHLQQVHWLDVHPPQISYNVAIPRDLWCKYATSVRSISTNPVHYWLFRDRNYTNFKKHNTVKFLIGITPCGVISYLSKCWDGQATDNEQWLSVPTKIWRCTDRDLDVADDIAIHGATLIIPLFTGATQLAG